MTSTRVAGSCSFNAVYRDEVKIKNIEVTIEEAIPDPRFTLEAATSWDGRENSRGDAADQEHGGVAGGGRYRADLRLDRVRSGRDQGSRRGPNDPEASAEQWQARGIAGTEQRRHADHGPRRRSR